jgi:hypothetical protein
MKMLRLLSILLLSAACAGAGAQSLYKCTVKGKVSYSGEPCKEGQTKAIAVPAAPEADPALADELKREKVALTNLERARDVREAQQQRRQVDRAAIVHEQRCARMRLDQQAADTNAERAPGHLKAALRDQAQHLAEALAAECSS